MLWQNSGVEANKTKGLPDEVVMKKICFYCQEEITDGKRISYLNNKYKIAGEEVCEFCVDAKMYKIEDIFPDQDSTV